MKRILQILLLSVLVIPVTAIAATPPASMQSQYEDVAAFLQRLEDGQYLGVDRELASKLAPIAKNFTTAYESGDLVAASNAWTIASKSYQLLIKEKPVFGYQYNEILRKEILIPIEFDLYGNRPVAYLRVGDGKFSTISDLGGQSANDLRKALVKCREWAVQCRKEKINAQKEIQACELVDLTFVSEENGKFCYAWLTAHAGSSDDALLNRQKVRLNMLNVACLTHRLGQINQMLDEWHKAHKNAERLK